MSVLWRERRVVSLINRSGLIGGMSTSKEKHAMREKTLDCCCDWYRHVRGLGKRDVFVLKEVVRE